MPQDGFVGRVFDGKSGSGGVADDANHSNRILLKPLIGVADGPDDPPLQVRHPTDVIQDGEICDIIEKTVHRHVSAQGILRRRSKTVCPYDLPFFCLYFFKFRSTPERGDLDDLSSSKKHMDQSESTTDDPAILKEGINLMRVGIGGHVEILRNLFEKKVPNASAHEIRQESMSVETVEDFQGLLVDHFSRYGVFPPWNDKRVHFSLPEQFGKTGLL